MYLSKEGKKLHGIYQLCFYSSWYVEIRLLDEKFERARNGDIVAQTAIIKQFKARAFRVYEKHLEQHIRWDDTNFSIKRLCDAYPEKLHSLASKQPEGCDCECARCDTGYHCHNDAKSCHLRP